MPHEKIGEKRGAGRLSLLEAEKDRKRVRKRPVLLFSLRSFFALCPN
jgi:hypothetical protein